MTDDLQRPQTAIEQFFFTPLYYPLSPFQVIGWWERRRLTDNVCVGAAGDIRCDCEAVRAAGRMEQPPFRATPLGRMYGAARW